MKARQSGILMHISSLPNRFGIGSLGKSAYDFVDFLVATKQRYWQVLPLGPTSYGDSPYQSFSAFAGNTHFIDFDRLVEANLLSEAELSQADFGQAVSDIDYEKIYITRRPLLEMAVRRFLEFHDLTDFQDFCLEEADWLDDFATYMAIKEYNQSKPWQSWEDEAIKVRNPQALADYRLQLQDTILYHKVTQFFFFEEWLALKSYANQAGVELIGDMPIYIASDSADMWSQPHLFKTDEAGMSTVVAGCPPDAFSETGQLWGNPIYDWQEMAASNYSWWIKRLKASFRMYDMVRIDHFRGFEAYWQIPAGEDTAIKGEWIKGPDYDLFDAIESQMGQLNIIAEDLGVITDDVVALREKTGFPGMKVLQFAFDPHGDSDYMPHHIDNNSVAYTGTHDNNTSRGWYEDELSEEAQAFFDSYSHRSPDESISSAITRLAWASPAFLAITTMQDLLNLPSSGRMNLPSTLGSNWQWRMPENAITLELKDWLTQLTQLYRRTNLNLSKENSNA